MKLIPIDPSGSVPDSLITVSDVGREVCVGTAALYRVVRFQPPWTGYLAEVDSQHVGTCAFKAPAREGRVEIAYFTFPGFEDRGFAKRMVKDLLAVAAHAMPRVRVTAQTLPEEHASTSVIKRNGFTLAATVRHPEDGVVWEWHRLADAARPSVAAGAPPAACR